MKHIISLSGGIGSYFTLKRVLEKEKKEDVIPVFCDTLAEDGTIRDIDNYICVASDDLEYGSIVETSLGTAKVYDCGCDSGTIDVYVNW